MWWIGLLLIFTYVQTLLIHQLLSSSSQAEQLKQVMIIASEADSAAAELLGNAFVTAGDSLIELRRLEAAEEIANNLSKSRNVAYLPGSGQNLLLSIPPWSTCVDSLACWHNLMLCCVDFIRKAQAGVNYLFVSSLDMIRTSLVSRPPPLYLIVP